MAGYLIRKIGADDVSAIGFGAIRPSIVRSD